MSDYLLLVYQDDNNEMAFRFLGNESISEEIGNDSHVSKFNQKQSDVIKPNVLIVYKVLSNPETDKLQDIKIANVSSSYTQTRIMLNNFEYWIEIKFLKNPIL